MHTFVTVIHCITCVLLVLVVLVQQGKGAEISASFGGSSQTVFGSSGGANFFSRFTQGAAAVFFVTSILLTIMSSQVNKSIFEGMPARPASATVPAPAVPAAGGAAPAQNAAPAEKAAPAQPVTAAPAAPAQPAAPAAH
jgi:preprotein translocase subunit SecG